MTDETKTPDQIAELFVHIGRAARSETANSSLTAAQWTCLRFFARANDRSRTPSGFASFQATTRGTASQTIKSLERLELIVRTRSNSDRRSMRFDLTGRGYQVLEQDPLRDLITVIQDLEPAQRERLLATLSGLSSSLAIRRDLPAFGSCEDCSHYSPSGDTAYCACMAAELAVEDIPKLCGSYKPTQAVEHSKETRDGAT